MTQQTQAAAKTKSISVIIDAHCHNEYADGPGHATFLLTQELLNTMQHLQALCQEHQLSEVRILRDIDWHNKEALRIQEEELVVAPGGAIWFTAYARDVDSNVETEMTAISALAEIFGETADGDTYSLATDEDDNDESDEPEDD